MSATRLLQRGPSRVLLVMEEGRERDGLVLALRRSAQLVQVAIRREEVARLVNAWQPHLIVIDADRPEFAAEQLLGRTVLPVIALTRREETARRVRLLQEGMDDVVVLDRAPDELPARVLVVLRRAYGSSVAFLPRLRVGDLEIDASDLEARAGNVAIRMTALEHALLYFLAANAGRLVTREAILDALWGPRYAPESNVVDRHIHALRTKLSAALDRRSGRDRRAGQDRPGNDRRHPELFIAALDPRSGRDRRAGQDRRGNDRRHLESFIQTVHGQGYRLVIPNVVRA